MPGPTKRLDISPALVTRGGALKVIALTGMLALTTCGQPDGRALDELVRDGSRYLEPETMQPYSGVAFATFQGQPGAVAHRLNLWNGTYHGPFESYFRSQNLSAKESYVNGVRHGPFEWYFESGELFEEGTYVEGRREGPYRAYWETGDLYEEGTYLDGDFDGPRRWYSGGKLVELVTYRRGVIDGLYERYREDGSLDLKGMLQNGSPCGVWFEDDRTITYPVCGIEVTE
jgi:hypothetical protein